MALIQRLDPRAVRDRRLRRGWTVADLAAASGVNLATLYRVEADDRMRAHMSTIRRLAAALEVEIPDLLQHEPPMARGVDAEEMSA